MARRTKTVDVMVRVRVPLNWTQEHARRELADNIYGPIYASGPRSRDNPYGTEAVLMPRFVRGKRAGR